MTVMAVLGLAITQLLISDTRFVERQEAMLGARQAARAALNVMTPELRMVSDGGLLAATADSVVLRVPYAFGMTCGSNASATYLSVMPPDSLSYWTSTLAGLAWRDPAGAYQFVSGIAVADTASVPALCTSAKVAVVPGGFAARVTPATAAPTASVVYMYQVVTFRFGTSVLLPGRRALWRRVGTSPAEELVVPFDSSARFRFLLGPHLVPSDTVPANLATVRGLELRVVGASETPTAGGGTHATFSLVARVRFANRP